jgi:hypothetical protein
VFRRESHGRFAIVLREPPFLRLLAAAFLHLHGGSRSGVLRQYSSLLYIHELFCCDNNIVVGIDEACRRGAQTVKRQFFLWSLWNSKKRCFTKVSRMGAISGACISGMTRGSIQGRCDDVATTQSTKGNRVNRLSLIKRRNNTRVASLFDANAGLPRRSHDNLFKRPTTNPNATDAIYR